MGKKILGLDLGTTSIGWAFVTEEENSSSSIHKLGVRVVPLSTDEQTDFEKGKPITINADRTLKRSMRRNLQRYKQRRANLIDVLIRHGFISPNSILAETDPGSTHSTYRLRAMAAEEGITKEQLAQVLLMINKKRGYRSSRKVNNPDEGQLIDGMAIAKKLYEEQLTPGQLCLQLLTAGKKSLPDFYRSDLESELDKVWQFQQKHHPDILTPAFLQEIKGKGQRATAAIFWNRYGFNTAENKGSREEKKLRACEWRSKAIHTPLSKEEVAYVITEINGSISGSSGYLGAISDRSKELYFNKQTVGQYLYRQLAGNPHARMKNQVFYRQDYLDEFEAIWTNQARYHADLTEALKIEIRDIVIFYQRKLRSQKGLISICEFEQRVIETGQEGKTKTIGYKVAPRSSPLFQQFKIWQNLHHLRAKNRSTGETLGLDMEAKQMLFDELNTKGNLSKEKVLALLGQSGKNWELNFTTLEGNRTQQQLYDCYLKIIEQAGYDVHALLKLKADKDDLSLSDTPLPANEIKKMVTDIFQSLGIQIAILDFDPELEGKEFEKQPAYLLWHLLYSYEEDGSVTGNNKLIDKLQDKFGFTAEQGKLLAAISFSQDYANLSTRALRKIYPFIRESMYSEACASAGYNHSSSLTREDNDARPLKPKLELLPKNSLRNPVVEKILNQLVHVVNQVIADPSMGHPDEIRIELARELKKNAAERAEMTANIEKTKKEHESIVNLLKTDFHIPNPTRNDIIRYKLYEELRPNGYKTLYSNTYIPREKLFSKDFDVEHIIPRALLFDDSFSNKTICVRQENLDKGNTTAMEYIESVAVNGQLQGYRDRVEMMFKVKEGAISKAKYKKLLMRASEIGDNFIERDLRNTQYIVKKARQMLLEICRTVLPTTGSITERLREDWNLVNVMQELNFEKYQRQGLTEKVVRKDGSIKERIVDWNKRNDHRHHAMDALTVAFTRHSHIQYLNYLHARKNKQHKMHGHIMAIEQKETELVYDDAGRRKRKFKAPMHHFRQEAKKHLEEILISYKAKNKVVTRNKNTHKIKGGEKTKIELTPRGQLHKETVYGQSKQIQIVEEKPGSSFDEKKILQVCSPKHRMALLSRLQAFDNDPKKAFTGKNSPEKVPIYLDEEKTMSLPEKVKLLHFEEVYTIRKEIAHDLKIEKVLDKGIQQLLQARLEAFGGKAKEAFADLDKTPIWQNQEKGIAIKRVRISGVSNAEALHTQKDHHGATILDTQGHKIPSDYISTGSNHHVALYRDAEGNIQDRITSFYEAVARATQGLPVIDRLYNQALGWQFLYTMKQNECFVFSAEGFDPKEIDLMNPSNNRIISPHLYRVQKLSKTPTGNSWSRDYVFRHHLETTVADIKELKGIAYKSLKSLSLLDKVVKVRINHLGQIVRVGEY